ncbi:hypothetical protein A6F55_23920 [Prescottella equi]|uniref:hypothetical protein n=1 Tax=Rhodococcus hoagii TaxID=43767 RepID=UPI000A1062AF|nr:hypothetical protein [Prescottella equi]ORJ92613.1 hypothetical protein A6F55_23920 [Prescottella equi]
MNPQLIGDLLRPLLESQPWYRKFSNTATSLAGLVVSIVWTVIAVGIDLPNQIVVGVLVAIAALTTVGVKNTPNGVTERQIAEIERYAAERRG